MRAAVLLVLACTQAPAAAPAPAPRYYLVGAAGARSFEAPGGGDVRKLLPGFGMSIVEEHAALGRRWGHTAQGRWVALSELTPARPAALAGVVVTKGALDFGWVVAAGAPLLDSGGKRVGTRPLFSRQTLNGCTDGLCRAEGGFLRAEDLRVPKIAPRPAGVGATERWLDVDLASQTLVAYEGDRPVFATLVSTGIGAPGSAFATPPGVFHIRSKHRTATMDNLEHTEVVPYSYEDIPLVQYFTDRVALHAALWHQSFGHPASHGCINLSPADAERLFAFTSPRVAGSEREVWVRPGTPATVVRVRGK
ncbi:MAG TPA: L,D-transpeptidase [Polyangia bacterium]|nr:L,D-transpeptidase [Polyangia bacterium]